ncbi:hypothetical protein AU210_009700 [Fusarium oxysporum f. sp. radicis-cucumerinum]|uniref:UAS domain-containing protein n=1 Tax=Fusarium oxysporum f. sp. radicis-cucumerinum TaxID=327505 RepID=A0A2H3GS98_FUSOX|nr:hypothetical protein AU210_009700 [Fusarium oxysporum f. sp. radicis-cucumerinum]
MAEGDMDLGQLSTTQQEALDQYTQVTNQEISEAIPLLRRSEWNVQIAIAKFFDGEVADPVAAAQQEIPRAAARHENLQESLFDEAIRAPRASPRQRTDLAPRIVPQNPVTNRTPWLLGLLLTPFSLGWRAASTLFRTLIYALSFLPASIRPRAVTSRISTGFRGTNGRRPLMPRDTASRFKREFEEEYGENELPFFEGGVAQAHDQAKKDLKFMLVVLMSPEHDDTESFVKETLLAPEVVDFIKDPSNNIILWGGNVLDSEAYQVAQEYICTKFPFSALVCLTPKEGSTRMGIVKRLVGPMPPSTYLSELRAAIEKYGADLDGREQWIAWRAATIVPEPPTSDKSVVRVALKMPEESGIGRIVRRFPQDASLEDLYAFVECYSVLKEEGAAGAEKPGEYEHEYKFRIASILPRTVYEPSTTVTMGEKIGRSGNLIVEDISPDSEDESDDEGDDED